MKSHKTNIFFAVIIYLLCCSVACQNKSKEAQTVIKQYKVGPGIEIFKDELRILKVDVVDSLIIATIVDGEDYFKVYNSDDLKYLGSFAPKGNGPSEFFGPMRFNHHGVDKEGNIHTWIYDINKYTLFDIDLTKSLLSQETVTSQEILLDVS